MKKLHLRFVAIILSLLLATTVIYHPVKVKAAAVAAPTALEIVSYIMSVTGAVNLVTGGGVNSVANSIRDQLATKVSELMGTGIYTDSDGNYVFSSNATKDIYDILDSQSQYDCRVISSFGGLTPMAGLYYFGNPNFNNGLRNFISNTRTKYSSYICQMSYVGSGSHRPYIACYYDLSNVAYINIENNDNINMLTFYNKAGNYISIECTYYTYSEYYGTHTGTENRSYVYCDYFNSSNRYTNYTTDIGVTAFCIDNDISYPTSNYKQFTYNNFPFNGIVGNNGCLVWSNRSILIAKDSTSGYNKVNYPSGVEFANNYNVIPSVSPDVITNNNWNKIYNDYVNNVSNNVQYFYNSETNEYNYEEMYKYIKSFNNNITNEVNNGSTDIEQNIEYNNTWLSLIYDTLRSISVKLDNLSSGGGGSSCPWTDTDIQNMLSSLGRLENSLSQDVTTNQQIFAYLATLNQSILSIASSNNPQTIYNEYNNYYAALNGLPDADVLDFIGKTDVIKALLPTVAPFGFIALGSAIISGLAADPVDPIFVMPLKFNHSLVGQTVNIDEEITIDLTPFNSARIVLNAFLVLAFLISLIFITIELIHRFVDILGG